MKISQRPLRQPYPYTLAPVEYPDAQSIKRLNVWNVQEFFRIELLLRSRTVMDLYIKELSAIERDTTLVMIYGFTWAVLDGWHHKYLKPVVGGLSTLPGFTAMTLDELRSRLETISKLIATMSEAQGRELITRVKERFLGLLIDPSLSPQIILAALQPLLVERHKPGPSKGKPYVFKVRTWLDYLRCYDLRIAQGLVYGKITTQVYKKTGRKARDQAEKAVKRVQGFIRAAEKNQWPPSSSG